MKNNGIFKTMFILVGIMLVFLFAYNFLKKGVDLNFIKSKSKLDTLYYCEDDSYTLNNNMCFKNRLYSAYLMGDLDNNNIVNINDIEIIKDYIDGKKDLNNIQLVVADVNLDRIVDINDVRVMQDNLKDNNTDIGIRYACENEDILESDKCISKYSSEVRIENIVKGDINQNSIVDNNDLYLLYNYINNKGYLTEIEKLIADVNKDGKINTKDFNWYKKNRLKKIVVNSENKKSNNIYKDDDIKIDIFNIKDEDDLYNYYFKLKLNSDKYYRWEIHSDDSDIFISDCKVVNNNSKLKFKIELSGIKNYGIFSLFSDDECKDKITEYKTDIYNR